MATRPSLTLQQVQASNARIDADVYPRTAVFVGGTSGIGEAVIEQLAAVGKGKWPARIYVVGRQESAERVNRSLEHLRAENGPDLDLVWTPGDVSLLADVERICRELSGKERSLDLLWLSTGYAPMGGREETSEGLVISQCLGHYSRILFIQHLLPLLRASTTQGRIVSVAAGGRETARIDVNDLDLKKWGAFGWIKCQFLTITMLSMAMEQLAEENEDVCFIHASPGFVSTGNLNRGWRGRWLYQALMNVILGPIIFLFGFSIRESAERMTYLATSAKYGGHGVPLGPGVPPGRTTRGREAGGLFLVHPKGATVGNEKVMATLRMKAKEQILAKTAEVLRPYMPTDKP